MNIYTNTMNQKKAAHSPARNSQFRKAAALTAIVMLVAAVVIGAFIANRSAVAANTLAVPYSNALELQYAKPWLEAQNKPVVAFSNAMEMQYAQPWLEAQPKTAIAYSNALELQYARPWLEAQNRPMISYGNALELQYARPWIDAQQQGSTI